MIGTWKCYACDTVNDIVNPPDGDTDDECDVCGMSKPHSDAETTAEKMAADLHMWLWIVIGCPPTIDSLECMQDLARKKLGKMSGDIEGEP